MHWDSAFTIKQLKQLKDIMDETYSVDGQAKIPFKLVAFLTFYQPQHG
jgi:hypothetical protein